MKVMSQPIQADSTPKLVGLVGGSAAARRADLHSSRWTRLTLAVAIGHDDSTLNIVFDYYYYYYYYYYYLSNGGAYTCTWASQLHLHSPPPVLCILSAQTKHFTSLSPSHHVLVTYRSESCHSSWQTNSVFIFTSQVLWSPASCVCVCVCAVELLQTAFK